MEFEKLGVEINVKGDSRLVEINGPLGSVSKRLGGSDLVFYGESVFAYSESSYQNYKSFIKNCVVGVTEGYKVELTLVGLGFKVIKLGNYLLLKLGHSHYIKFKNPEGMHIFGSKKRLLIFGVDKEEVLGISNTLRSFRKPDSYKGKGVRNSLEKIVLKIGKQK